LPFGQKNSGTEAQGPYRAAANELSKGRHGSYVDDWVGYSNSLTQLFTDFEVFLKVRVKYNITLGPHKTRFGFPEAQFFGFRVNAEGSHLALKHLDPIRQMVSPSDIHELRRVLGLFVVSRKYIRDFALTKPMTDVLRGKNPVFFWKEPQQKAFDVVRDKFLTGVHLAAPNFDLPFHLATDASEDGKGGELYQLPSVPVEDQFPYDAKLHAPENHAVILFISKAFNETQRLKPPFYLEGDSLLWGTDKSRYYALSSKYPLYTYSDHMPLNWMHETEKGPISSFIIESLSELETVHQYIQGKLNTLPDNSCSRFPMLGPRDLAPRGYTHSVEELLRRLPASLKEATLVHFHGGKNNAELRATLKLWFKHVSSLQPVTPPREGSPPKADVAILTPRCETTPLSVALYLLSDVPFALLMPVNLLAQARQSNLYPGCPHEMVAKRLAKAGKITILDAQMVWVVGNVSGCCPIEVFSAHLRTPAP
jgi:hypothetical protein